MRANDISQWEKVYLSNRKTFPSCNNRNMEIYRSIDETEYETLDQCAEYWIKNQSHAAFVHFFIEKGKFPDELFVECINEKIKEFENKHNCKINWLKLRVMKKEYWLSPDIEPDKLMDKEYCYKKDYVSRLCKKKDIQAIKYKMKVERCRQKEREEKENGKKQKEKTVETYSVPDREIIIQLGIYLNLNSKDVNVLLDMAGLPRFYIVDVVDAVSMYYIDKYYKDGIDNSKMWQEEGENRIIETKEGINRVLHIMLDEVNDRNKNHENLRSKMYTVEIKKTKNKEDNQEENKEKNIPPYRKIVYQYSLCDTVDEEIERFMEEIEPEKDRGILDGNTLYITKKINELYQKNKSNDFKTLIDQVILQKSKDAKYVSAIEYRYGYMRKLHKAMHDAIMKRKCEKNFQNMDWKFSSEQPWKFEFLKRNLPESKQVEVDEKKKKKGLQKNTEAESKIRKEDIFHIWYCEDFIEQGPWGDSKVTLGSSYSLDYYIRNRPLKVETIRTREDGSEERLKESVKIPQTMSKTALTKFTIVTGIEDKRDKYFEAVGYGIERKLYKNAIEVKDKTRSNSYPVDRSDMLFEYVEILRDKLIEKYVENDKEKDTSILSGNLKNSFPFARMMNYITRDIQYVLEFIACREFAEWESEDDEKRKEILKKEDELVVQKDRLQKTGNSGYCLCFPYSIEDSEWYEGGKNNAGRRL